MQRRVRSVGVWNMYQESKRGGKQGYNDVALCEISFSTKIELLLSDSH